MIKMMATTMVMELLSKLRMVLLSKLQMVLLNKLKMVVLSKLRMVMEWPMLRWNQPLMSGDKEESQSVTVKVLVEV